MLFLILLLSTILLFRAAVMDSPTFDEPLHLQSAREWVTQLKSPTDPFNPPLAKLLPYYFEKININPRAATILLTLILLTCVYLWTKKTYDTKTALVATFLLGLEPNILAHGHLVTTDLASTLIYFLVITSYLSSNILRFWIFLGLAAATKITLLPMIAVFVLVIHKSNFFKIKYLVICGLILWLANFGQFFETLKHALSFVFDPKFDATRKLFYFGMVSGHGWFSYPLVSFLIKTSVPLLILLIFAPKKNQLFLAAICVMIVVTIGRYSTGVRHLLPMYPFLAIIAARTKINFLVVVLLLLHLATAVYVDNPIAFFNIGDKIGPQIIADSNFDWGQNKFRMLK